MPPQPRDFAQLQRLDRLIRERQRACQTYVNAQVILGLRPSVRLSKCRDCFRWAENYHHPNYQYPDLVIPVCSYCHRRYHRDSPPSWDWFVEQIDWEDAVRATR